mmetsp:Transcript_61578/g.144318  ORF Transcript_61578/g.144318 Transcript_61578/m.144318 type:complete len:429 (+) Transcript_61578:130-1416(+)
MPRGMDLPLNIALSIDMAPALHAIMLPLTIPTPQLQIKFLRLLGEMVEEAHHSAICSPDQRQQFKRALDCARSLAANSTFNTMIERHGDPKASPRELLQPTEAQEARQARVEPRLKEERSPRPAIQPLSTNFMDPIREEKPKRRVSKKTHKGRSANWDDFGFPMCGSSEERVLVQRRTRSEDARADSDRELGDEVPEDGFPDMVDDIDEAFMSSGLCQKDESEDGEFLEADFIADASTRSKVNSLAEVKRTASKGRQKASLARSSSQSMQQDSDDLAPDFSDDSPDESPQSYRLPKRIMDVQLEAERRLPDQYEAVVPSTEPERIRRAEKASLEGSFGKTRSLRSSSSRNSRRDQGIMSSLRRVVHGVRAAVILTNESRVEPQPPSEAPHRPSASPFFKRRLLAAKAAARGASESSLRGDGARPTQVP